MSHAHQSGRRWNGAGPRIALLLFALSALPALAARRYFVDPGARIPAGTDSLHQSDTTAWSRDGGGVASIEYNLPKAGHVRVRVFDAGGREIVRPVDEWQLAGLHMTMFAFGPSAKRQVFRYRVECSGRKRSGSGTITVEP